LPATDTKLSRCSTPVDIDTSQYTLNLKHRSPNARSKTQWENILYKRLMAAEKKGYEEVLGELLLGPSPLLRLMSSRQKLALSLAICTAPSSWKSSTRYILASFWPGPARNARQVMGKIYFTLRRCHLKFMLDVHTLLLTTQARACWHDFLSGLSTPLAKTESLLWTQ
jgi:hypothetical protein